jgi:hypothetical protein
VQSEEHGDRFKALFAADGRAGKRLSAIVAR